MPQVINERFVYNEASQLIAELGTTNRDYIWLDELPVAVVDNSDTGSTINYVFADGLGTPRAIQDANGATIWSWQAGNNSFGELPVGYSGGYVYNLRFPGQYYDAESGLFYNINRYLDPIIGRYTQVDPIGYQGGQASLYAYVNGNPLNYVDSLGLKNLLIGGNAGLIAVGGGTVGAGLYVSWGSSEGFDFGFYGSVGGGIGVNLGFGAQAAYGPARVS